jgi:hypothetical protein
MRQRVRTQCCANLGYCDGDPANDQISFQEVLTVCSVQGTPKKDRGEGQEHSHHSLSYQEELFTKNLSWQAKQSIPHATVMFYGDCLKICENFAPNFGDKITGCCITTTRLFTLPFSPDDRPSPENYG